MAIIDVVRYHQDDDDGTFVWKFPSDQLKLGTQVVVTEGQSAILVKGGQALDVFYSGTYTLSTGNIPLLDKLINLPFGGQTPFSAEVWFVSNTVKRNLKWGTPHPIPIMDATLGFPVSARSFGKWGVRVRDAKAFVTQLVGAQIGADSSKVSQYFMGAIIQALTSTIASMIARGEASILQINALLQQICDSTKPVIRETFDQYGIELINFDIESISLPESEMARIQDVFAKTMEARELSKVEIGDSYRTIKSFEVIQSAAENPSEGTVGSFLGAGLGIGAGLPIGTQIGSEVNITSSRGEPRSNGDNVPTKLRRLRALLDEELITQDDYEKKKSEILEGL